MFQKLISTLNFKEIVNVSNLKNKRLISFIKYDTKIIMSVVHVHCYETISNLKYALGLSQQFFLYEHEY